MSTDEEVSQPAKEAQQQGLTADGLVLEVAGWCAQGASAQRVRHYLTMRSIDPSLVQQACQQVREAVEGNRQKLAAGRQAQQELLSLEEGRFRAAQQVQHALLTAANTLGAQAAAVIVHYRPKDQPEVDVESAPEPEIRQPQEQPASGWGLLGSLVGRGLDLLREEEPADQGSTEDATASNHLPEVQLPAPDDPYAEIMPILNETDAAVVTTRQWDGLRLLGVEDGTAPERDLADMGTTYVDLLPAFERAQEMSRLQIEQSQGIIRAHEAHWARVRDELARHTAEITSQEEKLAAFEQACTTVEAKMREVEALTKAE